MNAPYIPWIAYAAMPWVEMLGGLAVIVFASAFFIVGIAGVVVGIRTFAFRRRSKQ